MGPERLAERAPTPREQRMRLAEGVTRQRMQEGVQEWMNAPKQTSDASRDRMHGRGMIEKLRGFRDQATISVPDAVARLQAPLSTYGEGAFERAEGIRDALLAEPPEFGEAPERDEHPYLRYKPAKPLATDPEDPDVDPVHQYTVDDARVQKDVDVLAAMRESFPPGSDAHAALSALIDQLNAYRLLDPRVAMKEEMFRTEGGRTMMDIKGKEMGRVALTGILAAGTVIFGTIGIVQFFRKGEISLAPFLWAFATLYVSDPKLVQSFFDKDAKIKNEFTNLRAVTGDSTMQEFSATYGIGGPGWARAIEHVYEGTHGTLHETQNPTEEAKDRVAADLADGDPRVQEALRRMMDTKLENGRNESDFTRFVNKLLLAKTEGAREFVVDYVERDAFREGLRLDPAAQNIVRQMQALREQGKAA